MTPLQQEFELFMASLRQEGEAIGRAKGRAQALLTVLGARGVLVDEIMRPKILAMRDLALLDQLLVQAATADSPEVVLAAAAFSQHG